MEIDFKKFEDGLVPAVIQDAITHQVLMLGYMNDEAFRKTIENKRVTFFSRSNKRLWTKGETSGNYLDLDEIVVDCDKDALLVKVKPQGPTCHLGTDTCWGRDNQSTFGFLSTLEGIVADRRQGNPKIGYTASLFAEGMSKIAQKVGEEAVEVVIEALGEDDDAFLNESADLLFHFMVLLEAKDFKLSDVEKLLRSRHEEKK